MKKSVVFTVAITFAIILVAWNVYLSMNINKYRKHPEKINIFLQQDDSIAQQISSIEDSLGVSIIVSDYENSQLDQTIGVLNNITTFFGHILAALAIFIAIIAALGLYEINNWRVLRKEIEEGEAKVNNLTLRVHTSIEQIDQRKNAFENNIKEIEKYDQSLDLKVKEFYDRLKNTQRELEFTISNFNEKQNEIIQDNFLFKEFKNNIFELFRKFRSKISKFLDEDLKKVKDANATESEYSEDLKRTLIDFLTFYNFFGALLKTISNEKLPLKDIDYFALGMAAYSVRSYDDSREFLKRQLKLIQMIILYFLD
ncbi:MAG: hypothetical protein IPJ74_19205 [Saprospiraceae bacterium]|nr:hypothetical protein [Saprospiraceae bacterium]